MKIICEFCKNDFERPRGRYNEAFKFHWKQYCSSECQRKAKTKRTQVTCENPLCKKIFDRTQSEIAASKLLFCSISCSTSYYNAIRQGSVLLRKCKRAGCDHFIHSTDLKISYCGGKCSRLFRQGLTSYTPKLIITKIQLFVTKNDRIPTRNELGYLNRLARKFFGTWNKAIQAAGYDPNPVMFAKHYLAKDGHTCDSMAEKIVDDYLFAREVEHQIHVPYPWKNGMKCDFKIGEMWVEIFGLEGNLKRYDELKGEKLVLAKQRRLKMICLSLKDVYSKSGLDLKLHQ